MKTKNARDPLAIALLDMIRSSMKMDLGYTYNAVIGYPINNMFLNVVKTPDKFISGIESNFLFGRVTHQ